MMDLALQLNLAQPKAMDTVASDSAFSDDSGCFAEVLQRELATEDDATSSADNTAALDQAGYLAATGKLPAMDSGWLANASLPGLSEQLAGDVIADQLTANELTSNALTASEFVSNALAAGQEVAAETVASRLIDATSGKAELPVEPGAGTGGMRLNQAGNVAAAADSAAAGGSSAGLLSTEELAFTDPQTGKRYQALAEFANALQPSDRPDQLSNKTERPHLFDLIGRARDFKPAAQEQLNQGGSKAGSNELALTQAGVTDAAAVISTDETMAGDLIAAQPVKMTAAIADGVVAAGKLSTGPQSAAGSAGATVGHISLDDSVAEHLLADGSAVALSQTGSESAGDLPASQIKADHAGNSVSQRPVAQANTQPITGPDNVQLAASTAAVASEAEVQLTAVPLVEVISTEAAGKKTNSFAEHMRAVNQQLKQQADSPAQQQASADPQQKGQEQAQQQQSNLPAAQQAAAAVAAAGTQSTFSSALHAEQQSVNTTAAVSHTQPVGASNLTVAASRPATELSAPVQIYEQQAAAQLKDKVIYQVTNKIQSAEIRLNPEDLGSVQIKLNLQQDQLNLQFTVSQPQAKEALEQQMPRLRELLEQQGLALAQSHVEQRGSQQQEQSRQFAGNSAGQSGQEAEAPAPAASVRASDRLVDYYA